MAGNDGKASGSSGSNQRPTTTTTFKAPTEGLEHIHFDYTGSTTSTKGRETGKFQEKCDSLGEYLALKLGLKGGADTSAAVKTGTPPSFTSPGPKPGDDGLEDKIWEGKVQKYLRQKDYWEENNKLVYNLFLQHCTTAMRTKLKGLKEWDKVSADQDGLGLMKLVK